MKDRLLLFVRGTQFLVKKAAPGTSLVVQWLRLCTSSAGGTGLIPGWRTKIPRATRGVAKKKKKIKIKK